MSNMSEFKYDWIWDKKRVSNPMMAKKMPLKNYEIISVFYKQQPIYNPQPTKKNTLGMTINVISPTKKWAEALQFSVIKVWVK